MNKRVSVDKKNPFKKYQEERVLKRIKVVSDYLRVLRRTRAKYEFVTDLAKSVAAQVSLVEGENCDYSTILRNPNYKMLLLNFMAGISPDEPSSKAVLAAAGTEAKLLRANLALGNSESEKNRLRTYILELEGKLDARGSSKDILALENSSSDEWCKLENELGMINKALWMVLEHCKEFIAIDRERGCIIDLAALKHKNTIVDGATAEPFLRWLSKNSNIG